MISVCWTGWDWTGWAAVAAIAQIVAALATVLVALGTLSALVFFWLQVRVILRGQEVEARDRREDFERSHTPYLSVQIVAPVHGFHAVPLVNVLAADCKLNADGSGVAYESEVTLRIEQAGQLQHAHTTPVSYLRAPASVPFDLRWQFGLGNQDRKAAVEFTFTSMFQVKHGYAYKAWINDAGGLRLDGPPVEMKL